MELQNKRALVTGATSGIGRETAILLAREGAVVIVAGRNAGNGARTVAATEANGGTAQFVAADVSDLQSVQRLANAAGEINILVNNAGAYPFSSTLEQDLASYEAIFDTNVRGTFFLTAALLPKMIAAGGGSIVNVTTIAGLTGILGTAVYGASKAAIDSTTRT